MDAPESQRDFGTGTLEMEDIIVTAAPNTSYFTPAQVPPAGTALEPQPNGNTIPELFQPLQIRGLRLQNRILVGCPFGPAAPQS